MKGSRMRTMLPQLLAASLLTAFTVAEGDTQPPAGTKSSALQQDLSEFEGLYRYRDGGTLFMVADGERLVAIVGEAKYQLRPVARDAFTNPSGARIPFVRDTTGRIVGFREHGDSSNGSPRTSGPRSGCCSSRGRRGRTGDPYPIAAPRRLR
jgi:hypothetical protein